MRVGTQVNIVKEDEGWYMMEVLMNGHFRTRYIDCRKAPRKQWNDIIMDNIAMVEDKIDMDVESGDDTNNHPTVEVIYEEDGLL